MNPEESSVSLLTQTLLRLIQDFEPVLSTKTTAIEFGILEDIENARVQPYLIDLVEDKSTASLELESVRNGVISRGMMKGKLIIFELDSVVRDALDSHMHNTITHGITADESYVFSCKMPDIRLISIISKHDARKLGFIFEQGSVLCHFAIILRERGIPAIVTGSPHRLVPGTEVTIDALSPELSGRERVS